MLRVLELLTLDMKVLGFGRQGHEVTGGVDCSPEAAQPSPLGGGREVRLGSCVLQQVVQVLSNLVVGVRWKGRQKRRGSAALRHSTPRPWRAPPAVPRQGQSFAGCIKQQRRASAGSQMDRQSQQLGSQHMAAAALLFLHYSTAWDTGCKLGPNWGSLQVPPGQRKRWGCSVSVPSLRKDSRVCSNPTVKPLYPVPLGKGRHSQGQPVQADTT